VSDFLATADGLLLTKAFTQIKDPSLRRSIVPGVGRELLALCLAFNLPDVISRV
jgi:hypothetical protein